MITSSSNLTSSSSSTNLLEINRYLRTQKDQAEEKYENLKLNSEINQQRVISLENDLNFYKRQAQAHEADIKHLQTSIETAKNLANKNSNAANTNASAYSQDNLNLMMETNRRLREEIESLTGSDIILR